MFSFGFVWSCFVSDDCVGFFGFCWFWYGFGNEGNVLEYGVLCLRV